jgi:hypothetical protein
MVIEISTYMRNTGKREFFGNSGNNFSLVKAVSREDQGHAFAEEWRQNGFPVTVTHGNFLYR